MIYCYYFLANIYIKYKFKCYDVLFFNAGHKPVYCYKESWHYFVKEAKAHKANPD